MTGAPLVTVTGASVLRGNAVVALPDLVLAPGARIGVVGRNGAGKTTLLRAIAGLDAAEGRIERTLPLRRIAFVAARPFLLAGDVLSNVALPMQVAGVPRGERATAAMDLLGRFRIADLAHRDRRALSEGQVQRVALARAFAAAPAVLLLDEPLASLDDAGRTLLAANLAAAQDMAVVAAAPSEGDLPPACCGSLVTM